VAETVPLFPLGTVLLPGASLPLHIFEPRYRQLTVDLVTGAVPAAASG
jgi:Lon protease-like protein